MDKQKIAIIGQGQEKNALAIMALKEKYGADVVIVTPEEAQEKGLKLEDIVNTPVIKITAPPVYDAFVDPNPKDGKARRRERRKKENKKK